MRLFRKFRNKQDRNITVFYICQIYIARISYIILNPVSQIRKLGTHFGPTLQKIKYLYIQKKDPNPTKTLV